MRGNSKLAEEEEEEEDRKKWAGAVCLSDECSSPNHLFIHSQPMTILLLLMMIRSRSMWESLLTLFFSHPFRAVVPKIILK